ncbi:MAG: aminotransferase class IV [bacterium]
MWIYLNNDYIELEQARLSPFDRGFLFSDGVYEVIRFYPLSGYFQADAHLERLRYGLDQLRITGVNLEELKEITADLLNKNEHHHAQAIAYIQVTRGSYYPRQHFFPPASTQPTLFITTSPFKPHTDEIEQGARVLLERDIRWSRCDIKTIALLPNILSRQNAVDQQACETIWSRDGFITEGTHTNFCAIQNGTLLTPPKSNFILSGITRQVVLDLCRDLHIPWNETPIKESLLKDLEECMIIGTTTEITPVISINATLIGNGKPGTVTRKLQEQFYRTLGST